jgi:hypothetical protein
MVNPADGGRPTPGYPPRNAFWTAVRKRAFRDPLLRASQVPADAEYRDPQTRNILKPNGQGQFAAVFKLIVGGENRAVRIYLSDQHVQRSQAHYRTLEEYFRAERPSWYVLFRHYPEEIEVRGGWYPVLTMDWIQGQTLGAWVPERARAGDQAALRQMADRWVALVEELQRVGVAHTDLQHGNVLVVNGDLKLIDYDAMYVPAYLDQPAQERGLEAYQHPERPGQPLSPALDHFAAWVIFLILRALAADPGLYERHRPPAADPRAAKQAPSQEEDQPLLFSEFNTKKTSDPEHSARLWDDLSRSPDTEVAAWANDLRRCLDRPFEDVPPFKVRSDRSVRADDLEPPTFVVCPHCRRANPLEATYCHWDGALLPILEVLPVGEEVQPAEDSADHPPPEPPMPAPVAAALESLGKLLGKPASEATDRRWCADWDRALLDGVPQAERLRGRNREARSRLGRLNDLRILLAGHRQGRAPEEKLLRTAAGLPTDYAYEERPEIQRIEAFRQLRAVVERRVEEAGVRKAWGCLQAVGGLSAAASWLRERLDKALAAVPRSDVAVAAAWEVCCWTGTAPTDPALQDDGDRALRRRERLAKLQDVLNTALPRDECDQMWLRTWDESLLADCPDADALRTPHEEVRSRVACWLELERAIQSGDAIKVVRLAKASKLAGYPPLERARAELAPLFERGKKAQRVRRILRTSDNKTIRAALDLPTIAAMAQQFQGSRAAIRAVVEDALAAARLQAGQPPYLLDAVAGQITLRWSGWNWPRFGLPDRWCLIALHPQRFLQTPGEANEETLRPRQHSCRSGGYTLSWPETGDRVFVTIWPTITLDWKQFGRDEVVGPPLHVGPIPLVDAKGRQRWWPFGAKEG